jgi:hypothetical protein
MKILWKVFVTVAAGFLAYLLAGELDQSHTWRLTMSIFAAGVVLVVTVMAEVAQGTREASALVASAGSANTLLTLAEGTLGGDSLTGLIEAAARIDRRRPGRLRFADRQVRRLTGLLEGLSTGEAEHRGDLDWRAGLTDSALARIDIAGMVTTDLTPEQDLDGMLQATKRGVRIRRVFLIDTRGPGVDYEPYRRLGVEVRTLHSDDFGFLLDGTLTEFTLFDGQLSYEVRHPTTLDTTLPTVTVVADEDRVARRQTHFEEIWDAAERV